ncbi:DUF2493 domain-containing protein [Notoacmeibacter sp. MSK16QG-6]|uniref:DUF2493 domain-containing protein n=1 Tax=Notoacmeibacter sp. MSK16QG-6 TaxID=2957982 RepID=UPI00209FB0CB|nr:DUF2493 domain-containing protein [Notoacmeibacter sp. MSK16QG-6]MCP1201070.1 DUF2493 domain-containing protein [Notoacmeibacter sp. MSK16QG-6]
MTTRPYSHASSSSPTAHLLQELALYGVRADGDERDYRLLPDPDELEMQIGTLMTTMADIFSENRLEDCAEEMLFSLVNAFHRRIGQAEKQLDDNEAKQRDAQDAQDGSEVRSVELERLVDQGLTLTETRNCFEAMRDLAAEHFHVIIGKPWAPRSGSKLNHGHLTAAMIDSRNYLAAKHHTEKQVCCPAGTKIAFSGGLDYQDVDAIWNALDKAHAKYPDMVLLYGGSPKGAELIAGKWAANRGVTAIAFKPDWKRHNKAAPFKRNDEMLKLMPQGLIATPGTGITDNLVDKARHLGIAVMRIGA